LAVEPLLRPLRASLPEVSLVVVELQLAHLPHLALEALAALARLEVMQQSRQEDCSEVPRLVLRQLLPQAPPRRLGLVRIFFSITQHQY
jgi:hypothetical protein